MNELIQYQKQPSIKSIPRSSQEQKRSSVIRSILKSQSSPRFNHSQQVSQNSQFQSTQSSFIQKRGNKSAEKRIPKLILNQLNANPEDFFITEYHKPVEVKRKSALSEQPKIQFKKQKQIDVVVQDLKRAVSQLRNIQQIIDGNDKRGTKAKQTTQDEMEQTTLFFETPKVIETVKNEQNERNFLIQQIEKQIPEKKYNTYSQQVSPLSTKRTTRQTFHFSRESSIIKQNSPQVLSTRHMGEMILKKEQYTSRQDQIQKIQDVLLFGQHKLNVFAPTYKEKLQKLYSLQMQVKNLMGEQKLIEECNQNIDSDFNQLKQEIEQYEQKVDDEETIKLSLQFMIEVRSNDYMIKKVPYENDSIMLEVLKKFLSSEQDLLGTDVKAIDKIKQEFMKLKRERQQTQSKQNLLDENIRVKENNDEEVQKQIQREILYQQQIEIEKQMEEQRKSDREENRKARFQQKVLEQVQKIKDYKSFFDEIQNNFQQIQKPSDILDQFHHVKESNQFLKKRREILQNKIANLRKDLEEQQNELQMYKSKAYNESILDIEVDQMVDYVRQKEKAEQQLQKDKQTIFNKKIINQQIQFSIENLMSDLQNSSIQEIKQFHFTTGDSLQNKITKVIECQKLLRNKLWSENVTDEEIILFKNTKCYYLKNNNLNQGKIQQSKHSNENSITYIRN
ncbi:hypothetical protein TTHERM_00657310 (macronuclear) [Tetrahymena thermophila SB210]|uniref:Uncharacterized protein n=1 Tax=Tetrahymena thermophila (strain SB210) TaxID=312017 RepID=I7MI03_TETTS|nr:hypothetical protein TTHERM_00657310 [Tetrahymena thermophila SB210]EAS03786.3 hypothetical protein TTHERM_00657310 [Tetrahymena thermophila SB210]|eukprot:XP_001024031.3 hypothetical protein TTHERM_00657310 [Tetrahymena thermophila SB210]